MKVNNVRTRLPKSQIVLILYFKLIEESISLDEFCEEYEITPLTFKRYIHDLRWYLAKYSKETIIYSKRDKVYKLA